MPCILTLETPDWDLRVWTNDIGYKQNQLAATLSARGKHLYHSAIRFSDLVALKKAEVEEEAVDTYTQPCRELHLNKPLFFENTQYSFEFLFNVPASETLFDAHIAHNLNSINSAFHFSSYRGWVLQGSVNFGNDIGWFRLPLCYGRKGEGIQSHTKDIALSFEVLPTKMDMASDLDVIHQTIDSEYPLWRFALAEKTEQAFDRSRQSGPSFPLLWLVQFEALREQLDDAVKLILSKPHSRLLPHVKHLKAERLKGKLPARLAEKVKEDIKSKYIDRRYPIQQKQLSVDTPENRFIKMVLQQSQLNLLKLSQTAKKQNDQSDKPRLSDAFFSKLADWQKPLEKYRLHPMFREIGSFAGMSKESLVLQQKAGYAGVYRVWQQLKLYLDVLGNQSSISMKSVAELYEVWCFLEIRNMLTEHLGFKEVTRQKALLQQQGLEKKLTDGMGAAFEFERDDGIQIKLAHEPRFNKKTKPIRSWLQEHKPDIVLEAEFKSGEKIIWIFDAKYRIKTKKETSDELSGRYDFVPNDAINQMHRYRDALIHLHLTDKARPVFGAFALYPGFYQQDDTNSSENPYAEAIEEIGIGAFPLLPSADNTNGSASGHAWLRTFLAEKLGKKEPVKYKKASTDRYYVEEAARIPYYGMRQVRYHDLTLVATGAPEKGRDAGYIQRFKDGTAQWYHMRLKASERSNVAKHVMKEIRYCAIATHGKAGRQVNYLWPVLNVSLVEPGTLKPEQTGGKPLSSPEPYWLFELGTSMKLISPLGGFAARGHQMKPTLSSELDGNKVFSELKEVYKELMK